MTNIVAANGVIYVIAKVIVPPADDLVATARAAGGLHSADRRADERKVLV